jgi:pseudouridine-5'-phosphate glycosidase
MGVPVLGYKTKELPAFYTPNSGLNLDYALKDEKNAAEIIKEKRSNKILDGGILVCVPIPKEYAMDKKTIDDAIEASLKKADELGIKGKDTTPFLLKNIVELTGGDSLESNIKLILNNAKVGAGIAKEYAKIKER